MRLTQIKLSGFKSFVDPTTIRLPGNLLGVVGPNGCGKSNIIDAVRWVMGEMSAKTLRGGSMADVIFAGSSARKPVASASVELVFDNSDGTIGGPYAGYTEVSIRRAVARDGTSAYYLNNTRCRRKDITNVFLGTGLGPRSYSIIEQGMISRVIEAKPEDLRAFLEEAAGISKYKERRRETENRVRHTRDNLSRLNDLRDEVEKQLNHLKRQAAVAERYRDYKQRERRLDAETLALKIRELGTEAGARQAVMREREQALERATVEQRTLAGRIAATRSSQADATEHFNAMQADFYRVGADIARLEQTLAHGRELRERHKREMAELNDSLAELTRHRERDQAHLERVAAELADLAPTLDAHDAEVDKARGELEAAEAALAQWRAGWESFHDSAREARENARVDEARIEHLADELTQVENRRQRLETNESGGGLVAMSAAIGRFATAERDAGRLVAETRDAVRQQRQSLDELRVSEREQQALLDDKRQALEAVAVERASLNALRQASRDAAGVAATEWIEKNGLGAKPRLAETIRVRTGWERAVETALGAHMEAVCVGALASVTDRLPIAPEGYLTVVESAAASQAPAGDMLAAFVEGPAALQEFLAGVRVAGSFTEALERRSELRAGESFITREGVWLGRGWIRVGQWATHGKALEREERLRELDSTADALSGEVDRIRGARDTLRERVQLAARAVDEKQPELDSAYQVHAAACADCEAARARLASREQQTADRERDASELEQRSTLLTGQLDAARQRHAERATQLGSLDEQHAELDDAHRSLRRKLESARSRWQSVSSDRQELAVKVESLRASEQSVLSGVERLDEQMARLETRSRELDERLGEENRPESEIRTDLESALASRLDVETRLNAAREALESCDVSLRDLEQASVSAEQAVEDARAQLENVRFGEQEIRVRLETVTEQFAKTDFELAELNESLDETATVEDWETELEKLRSRITRLGAINLAAIDEFKEQTERKTYLDDQYADLTQALETLDAAIRKIDRETRTRFKETYDAVDAGFKRLFPKLFGGGHGYLELSENDLLNAGVSVMARPPGKRISSIHLLSGGEKALTAVALVFAIFELNPSPFCMLDEVDAPLDDANVGRYCEIVRSMSERVQFVFITHNKVTMEMASHLMGVTMQEPGVSRLVAVDVDEAVQLAAV